MLDLSRSQALDYPAGWEHVHDADRKKKGPKFEHKKIPNQVFRFPFPVSSSITSNATDLSSPLLDFDTKSCTLLLSKSFRRGDPLMEKLPTSSLCLDIHLHDSNGCWAGVLESQFLDKAEYVEGSSCELIAISKAQADRRRRRKKDDFYMDFQLFNEMYRADELKHLKCYSFYNVLSIEWKGGIAYRTALGKSVGKGLGQKN
jgi:hypothetical protein